LSWKATIKTQMIKIFCSLLLLALPILDYGQDNTKIHKPELYDIEVHDKAQYVEIVKSQRNNIISCLQGYQESYRQYAGFIPSYNKIEKMVKKYFVSKNTYTAYYYLENVIIPKDSIHKMTFPISRSASGEAGYLQAHNKFTLVSGEDKECSLLHCSYVTPNSISFSGKEVMPEVTIKNIEVSYIKGISIVKIKNGIVTYQKNPPLSEFQSLLSSKLKKIHNGLYKVKYEVGKVMDSTFVNIIPIDAKIFTPPPTSFTLSQRQFFDTSVFKNSSFKPLMDCQKYSVDSIKNIERKELTRSYQFNDNGKISKILFSERGRTPDTMLVVLTYNKKNNIISKTNYYSFLNRDTLKEYSKILYFYNKHGLLERSACISFVEKRQEYDTLFVNTFSYNATGQKETDNLRNVDEDFLSSTGIKTFSHDKKGRLKEVHNIATRGKNHYYKTPDNNYTSYYTYFGDSSYKETQVFNLSNKEHNTFWEQKYFKNKNGQIVKTIKTWIQHVEILFLNGEYIPNPKSKTAFIQNSGTIYHYDELGRINKLTFQFGSEDKNDGWKTNGSHSQIFKYKDNKIYNLQETEFIEEMEE
jgi:hypothetical protein